MLGPLEYELVLTASSGTAGEEIPMANSERLGEEARIPGRKEGREVKWISALWRGGGETIVRHCDGEGRARGKERRRARRQ